MTIYFSNAQIQIRRPRVISGTNRSVISATYTAYSADVQPASPERSEIESGQVGKVYIAFVEVDTPVKEGDVIEIIESGKRYRVKDRNKWETGSLLDHIELVLFAEDDQ